MRFELAWMWLLVPVLAAWVAWLARRSYAQLVPAARSASVALRLTMLVLLVGGLAQPVLLRSSGRHHVVALLDVSRSVSAENIDAAIEDLGRIAAAAVEAGHTVSVIAFGEGARIVVPPSRDFDSLDPELTERLRHGAALPELYAKRASLLATAGADEEARAALAARIDEVETFRDEVAGDHTDVERAMRLAMNAGSIDERRSVYLFTDANFNRGRWQGAFAAAEALGVALHAVALDRPIPAEVAAVDLALPARVRINQGFSAELRLASTAATTAGITLFKDGYEVERRELELPAGETLVTLEGLHFLEKGFHTIEAVVRPTDDELLENNTIRSIVVVPGEARVLYVDGDEDQIPYLESALELEGIQVDARPATGVPQALSELLSFDAFILSNVPADQLSHRQMQMVRTYVRDFGGGFIMLGGDESFGLGGYYGTIIEEILPVRMPIDKDMQRPSLAVMLVIDKSGSMEGAKIQLAKRAATATAEAINPRDEIGVIGFDGEARVILELTPAADRGTISSRVGALEAGGGTFLYPALEAAHDRLSQSGARHRHVIVLSDGQTQGFGYEDLVGRLAGDGITLSAVGIGDGADMNLIEGISAAGGGRAYFTNDFYTIPQIFTREALRASKNMLVEGLVQPVAMTDDAALREIDTDELPMLTGYVATTPRPAADLILASDSGDPLLARWRYGLGHTAVFTSETKPRWAEDWIQWSDFAKFWSQLIRSLTGEDLGAEVSIETSHDVTDDGVRLSAEVRGAGGDLVTDVELELTAVEPSGSSRAIEVERVGPGRCEAMVAQIAYGRDEQFAWHYTDGERERTSAYGYVYSFSPEFRTLGLGRDTLEALAARSSGEPMRVGEARFIAPRGRSTVPTSLWPAFLAAALLLVPLDILVRRLG